MCCDVCALANEAKVTGAELVILPGIAAVDTAALARTGCSPGQVVEDEANIDVNPNAEGPNILAEGAAD